MTQSQNFTSIIIFQWNLGICTLSIDPETQGSYSRSEFAVLSKLKFRYQSN